MGLDGQEHNLMRPRVSELLKCWNVAYVNAMSIFEHETYAAGLQGSKIRAASNEGHLLPRRSEPSAQIATDRTGADHSYFHVDTKISRTTGGLKSTDGIERKCGLTG